MGRLTRLSDRRLAQVLRTALPGIALIVLLVIGGRAPGPKSHAIDLLTTPAPTPVATLLPLAGSPCSVIGAPSPCLYGLTAVRYVVHSQYGYEANLLCSRSPVDDIDYLLPYGDQQMIRLPGHDWDRYAFLLTTNVDGSGWVAEYRAPNGGCFDYLHLQYTIYRGHVVVSSSPTLPPPVFPANTPGDVATLQEISAVTSGPPTASVRTVSGGTVVGRSMWPTWPIYGNGTSGPGDAHLCVLVDAKGLAWLNALSLGHDPEPPFPAKRWGRLPYKDRHGRLFWQASQWLHHQWLGVYRRQHYERKRHHMRYAFQRGWLECAIKTHSCKAVKG